MQRDARTTYNDSERTSPPAVHGGGARHVGAENALGGMAQAFADNVPILVMLGGVSLNRPSQ